MNKRLAKLLASLFKSRKISQRKSNSIFKKNTIAFERSNVNT